MNILKTLNTNDPNPTAAIANNSVAGMKITSNNLAGGLLYNSIILNYINRNVFDLVKESHLNLFWKENEKNIIYAKTNIEYDITDIFK